MDGYAIGAFLFQLYARARVSDLRNISKLELDLNDGSGFIEVRTYEHKNSRLGSGAGAVLILVAPYHGLHVQPWGQVWVQAASAVGFAFDKGHRGPVVSGDSCTAHWGSHRRDFLEPRPQGYPSQLNFESWIPRAHSADSGASFAGVHGEDSGVLCPRSSGAAAARFGRVHSRNPAGPVPPGPDAQRHGDSRSSGISFQVRQD